jgi:pimeloyl-ACP methyl ester carboxylesterase
LEERVQLSLRRTAALAGLGTAALAAPASAQPTWHHCGQAPHTQCARFTVPLDYDEPSGRTIELFVARLPAIDRRHRLGTLFVNFGGPGGSAADVLESLTAEQLPKPNERWDIIGMDPRGVGQSRPAIGCGTDIGRSGLDLTLFPRPSAFSADTLVASARSYAAACAARDGDLLEHVSTANVVRDMDLLRRRLGERRIAYFGQSYGTYLGATYAKLFPRRYRAMVLDSPLDPDAYAQRPLDNAVAGAGGFEDSLDRFLAACAADQATCRFGGADPRAAFDALVAQLDRRPAPAGDARPADGGDVLAAAFEALSVKAWWVRLAHALADAAAGDGTGVRALADGASGILPDGSDPTADANFAITAAEQLQAGVGTYLRAGELARTRFPHFWYLGGYLNIIGAVWPAHDEDAFHGPFKLARDAAPPLIVATTHDPITPYPEAIALRRELGKGRLLTQRGDGHTVYPGSSPCVDHAIDTYFLRGRLPAPGKTCDQAVTFSSEALADATAHRRSRPARRSAAAGSAASTGRSR